MTRHELDRQLRDPGVDTTPPDDLLARLQADLPDELPTPRRHVGTNRSTGRAQPQGAMLEKLRLRKTQWVAFAAALCVALGAGFLVSRMEQPAPRLQAESRAGAESPGDREAARAAREPDAAALDESMPNEPAVEEWTATSTGLDDLAVAQAAKPQALEELEQETKRVDALRPDRSARSETSARHQRESSAKRAGEVAKEAADPVEFEAEDRAGNRLRRGTAARQRPPASASPNPAPSAAAPSAAAPAPVEAASSPRREAAFFDGASAPSEADSLEKDVAVSDRAVEETVLAEVVVEELAVEEVVVEEEVAVEQFRAMGSEAAASLRPTLVCVVAAPPGAPADDLDGRAGDRSDPSHRETQRTDPERLERWRRFAAAVVRADAALPPTPTRQDVAVALPDRAECALIQEALSLWQEGASRTELLALLAIADASSRDAAHSQRVLGSVDLAETSAAESASGADIAAVIDALAQRAAIHDR